MIRTTLPDAPACRPGRQRGNPLKKTLAAAALALASAGAAQAAVITFEGLTGPAYNRQGFQEAGYQITFFDPAGAAPPGTVQVGRFVDGSNPSACGTSACPTNNPSTYFDLFSSGFVDTMVASNNGATFSFGGLDAAFIGRRGVDYPTFPAALQVIGFMADGSQYAEQFNLMADGAFNRFLPSDDFAQLRFTEIAIVGFQCDANGQCSGLDGGNAQIGLDNITLSDLPVTGNVPEPATASLLALGALGFGARLRRRS